MDLHKSKKSGAFSFTLRKKKRDKDREEMSKSVMGLHSPWSQGRGEVGRSSSTSHLYSVLAPRWWNELPAHLKTAESLNSFSKTLKTHLFRVHLDSA